MEIQNLRIGESFITAGANDWTVKVFKEHGSWTYKLFYKGKSQGTEGSCADEKDAQESAAKVLKDAKAGQYVPPRK